MLVNGLRINGGCRTAKSWKLRFWAFLMIVTKIHVDMWYFFLFPSYETKKHPLVPLEHPRHVVQSPGPTPPIDTAGIQLSIKWRHRTKFSRNFYATFKTIVTSCSAIFNFIFLLKVSFLSIFCFDRFPVPSTTLTRSAIHRIVTSRIYASHTFPYTAEPH